MRRNRALRAANGETTLGSRWDSPNSNGALSFPRSRGGRVFTGVARIAVSGCTWSILPSVSKGLSVTIF